MARRISLCLLSLMLALGLAAATGWARPGGGQNYRAPTRSYSPPPRSYSPPTHTYSPPTHTYSPPSHTTYSTSSTPTYVPTPTPYPYRQSSGISGGTIIMGILILGIIL